MNISYIVYGVFGKIIVLLKKEECQQCKRLFSMKY